MKKQNCDKMKTKILSNYQFRNEIQKLVLGCIGGGAHQILSPFVGLIYLHRGMWTCSSFCIGAGPCCPIVAGGFYPRLSDRFFASSQKYAGTWGLYDSGVYVLLLLFLLWDIGYCEILAHMLAYRGMQHRHIIQECSGHLQNLG